MVTADTPITDSEETQDDVWKEILQLVPDPDESFKASFAKSWASIANLRESGTLTDQDAQILLKSIIAAFITWHASRYVEDYFLCPKCRERLRLEGSHSSVWNLFDLFQMAHRR